VIKPLSNITDLGLLLLSLTIIFYSSTTSAEHKLTNIEALPSQSLALDFERKDAFKHWSAIGDQEKQIIGAQIALRSADFDMDFEH